MTRSSARIAVRSLLALLLAAAFALAGAAAAQDGAQEGEVVEIEMITEGSTFYFDPVGVVVEPGTTIRFVNVSGQHSATAYSEANGKPQRIPEGAESWDSGVLTEEGATFEVTLDVEGVYDYYCIPHEMLGMVGRIVVGSADAAPAAPGGDLPPAVADALPSVEAITGQDDGALSYEEMQGQ